MRQVVPVILSGGSGTRLWPVSRQAYPKQFVPLLEDTSLFQQTLKRLIDPHFAQPLVIANNEHRFIVAEQARATGAELSAILLEPVSRNTAAPALIAALKMASEGSNKPMLLLPSDHLIKDHQGFVDSMLEGWNKAVDGSIVTFGIRPTTPETGYGYLETDRAEGVRPVKKFVEKPDADTAKKYLDAGTYYWNSGIFLVTPETLIKAFRQYVPKTLKACKRALKNSSIDLDFIRLDETAYKDIENVSIDYAVMEKSDAIHCVPLKSDWDDLGSWSSVWSATPKDDNGNASTGDVVIEDSQNCYARAEGDVTLVLLGLKELSVIATKDAILVTQNSRSEDIKGVVEHLRNRNHESVFSHSRVYRPWGWYERLEAGDRFQVKCLSVKPGEKLSLQSHHHRSEHWVVVSGTALVTVDEKKRLLGENESVYIPLGARHRLENPGQIPSLLIEVQSGSYLGEDDIVRHDDVYNRLTVD